MTNSEEFEKVLDTIEERNLNQMGEEVMYIGCIAKYLALIADELGTIANAIGGEYTG